MADRTIKLRELTAILRRFGVDCSTSRGKGSHLLFSKEIEGSTFTYPVPTHNTDVKICYVRGCRKKFHLREEDGITDTDFYGS
jgi:hypothetical protein